MIEAIDYKTAIDFIEPDENDPDLVRDARVRSVAILNRFAAAIDAAMAQPGATIKEVQTVFWGICFSLGLNVCEGHSMSQLADEIGVARATLSKIAVAFGQSSNLPPSWYQKKETARAKYCDARRNVVEKSTHDKRNPKA